VLVRKHLPRFRSVVGERPARNMAVMDGVERIPHEEASAASSAALAVGLSPDTQPGLEQLHLLPPYR
jgi:hypothetical protein